MDALPVLFVVECGYMLDLGLECVGDRRIDSMKELLAQDFDAVFVGSGAPRGRDLDLQGRREGAANIHVGLDWLANVYFAHVTQVGKRVLVRGGVNTARDCCRPALRPGGRDGNVLVGPGAATGA